MKEVYLPYYTALEKKYKDIYMEWSKEELIDCLVGNIKNGEVLLDRINKAIKYIENETWFNCKDLLEILRGDER